MPGLNSAVNSSRNTSNENNSSIVPKIGFFGMVGTVMAALSLKEKWNQYKQVPTEPVPPPAYRDDDFDEENDIGLNTAIDTSIPSPRAARRSRKGCCVCCGLNCALFCKALGIVILIFTIWNTFKFAKWMLTPSPTGLENMPEFSKSLGCQKGSYLYEGKDELIYMFLPDMSSGQHLNIRGGAVGTITFEPSAPHEDNLIKIRLSIRSNEKDLLERVSIDTGAHFTVDTPSEGTNENACMRYDLTMYIPSNLEFLNINSRSVAQVKFSDSFENDPRVLQKFNVKLTSPASTNLLLSNTGFSAERIDFQMRGGYLAGSAAIVNETRLSTTGGDAITNVKLITTPRRGTDEYVEIPAHLITTTGTGRSEFTYDNAGARQIQSEHTSRGNGDLYLQYLPAEFNGLVHIRARSWTTRGLHTEGLPKIGEPLEGWVSNKEGGDSLTVSTQGWVSLVI